MRSIIPIIMAGVLGIYGLITAIIIQGKVSPGSYSEYTAYAHFAAGLAIGVVGDSGVRAIGSASGETPQLSIGSAS